MPEGVSKDESEVHRLVADGKYQIGLVVRKGSTQLIRERGYQFVENTFSGKTDTSEIGKDTTGKAEIVLYFDPVIKKSFREGIHTALEVFTSKLESKILYGALSQELAKLVPDLHMPDLSASSGIRIQEIYATNAENEIIPNSVQHNVPAWTIFAMFFIVIPLTGNIVKERDTGTSVRLKIMPGNYLQAMGSKLIVYLVVCLIQMVLMLWVGIYVVPALGLTALTLGPHKLAILVMGLTIGLAATGYGVLIGTVATTLEQGATFGSISVIILAALGGLWVPVFMMSKTMQVVSRLSPLNWGLEGFYRIFLHGEGILGIWKYACLLLLFFIVTMGISIVYNLIRIER